MPRGTTRKVQPGETGIAIQPALDGLVRSDKLPTTPRLPESVMQAQIRQTIAFFKYESMETGNGRKAITCKCPNCGHSYKTVPTGWQGNSVGFPDLSVFQNNAFPPVFMQFELKGHNTKIAPEQQRLADQGRSIICHSPAEVIQGIIDTERALTAYRCPDERLIRLETFLRENARQLGPR